ncbi:MAG TPA: dTDP-4-dehydrorhamnose 3,5-epimerase family protein, partial [Caldimonas sp.]|nr:dTDP-4-dehydrorhamnose 3,5-epimerase family protein [Caldimonas sp.]
MSRRLVVEDTPLSGLKRVRRLPLGDARGFLVRLFCADELRDAGWRAPVAQVNQTRTRERSSVRGMHYQRWPHAEMKLVHCLRG